MQEFDFPLFHSMRDNLACLQGRVRFGLEDLISFCEHVHYSGSYFFDQERYEAASAAAGPLRKDLEINFVSRGGRVYLRGRNYYLGGSQLASQEKIRMMFRNIRAINSMVEKLCSVAEPKNVQEAALIGSVFDHMKHYFMIAFNAIYRRCIIEGRDDALVTAFNQCGSLIDAYYGCILNGKIGLNPVSEEDINLIERGVESRFVPTEVDFYREMDNPQRILLHSGNVIANAGKKYCVVVNPLSGATEPGFALKTISEEVGQPVVTEVFPLRYSIYQDEEGEVHDFDSLLMWAVPKCFLRLLPSSRTSPILILDDNIATGETLARLKVLFEERFKDVDISAIEARMHYYPSLDEYDTKTEREVLEELAFMPVGEARRNNAVNMFINECLLTEG